MAYATKEELKAQIQKTGAGDDTVIDAMLAAAEDTINGFCNRPDGFVALTDATARLYTGSGKNYQWMDECTEVTAVGVKDSITDSTYVSWASSDYILASGDPKYPNFNSTPYHMLIIDPAGDYSIFTNGEFTSQRGFPPETDIVRGVPTVQITAKWGYATTVPPRVKQATITQASIWYKRGQGAWSKVLAQNEMGEMDYDVMLDPAVKMMLVLARLVRKSPTAGRR